jgi:anti-sigma B factor antagonist
MQIEERAVDAVTILELKGKLTLGDGDTLLKDKIHSLVDQDRRHIVLDLGDLTYVDSAGLGEIVRSLTTVTRGGGSMKLLNLNKRIQDLMVMTKLITVFDTFETEADAVRSFAARV